MTKDITTTPASAPQLQSLDELKQAVHDLASLTLILKAAEADQQLKIEAAKKAFDEATRETTERHATLLSSIQAFCEKHKDMLFPVRKGKRSKTFPILGHELKYRSVAHIEAPANVLDLIHDRLSHIETVLKAMPDSAPESQRLAWQSMADATRSLIRSKEELNKEAAKTQLSARPGMMAELRIQLITQEDFSVAINPTPAA